VFEQLSSSLVWRVMVVQSDGKKVAHAGLDSLASGWFWGFLEKKNA